MEFSNIALDYIAPALLAFFSVVLTVNTWGNSRRQKLLAIAVLLIGVGAAFVQWRDTSQEAFARSTAVRAFEQASDERQEVVERLRTQLERDELEATRLHYQIGQLEASEGNLLRTVEQLEVSMSLLQNQNTQLLQQIGTMNMLQQQVLGASEQLVEDSERRYQEERSRLFFCSLDPNGFGC